MIIPIQTTRFDIKHFMSWKKGIIEELSLSRVKKVERLAQKHLFLQIKKKYNENLQCKTKDHPQIFMLMCDCRCLTLEHLNKL